MSGVRQELTEQPSIIRYTGTFEYDQLYNAIVGWYKAHGFDMHEKRYVHKGDRLEFEWFGDKNITEYYKYEIEVAMFVWDFKTVEAIKNEQKVQMQQGRIQIIIKGAYILDYEKQWEGSKFSKTMREIYHKFIIKKDIILKVNDPLYKLVYDFYDKVRDVLGMEHT